MKLRFSRIRIIAFVTFVWIAFQSWFLVSSVYLLNNTNIIDTSTIIQSLNSALFSHQFFVNTVPGGSFFSVHASFLLFFLLPFYSVLPGFQVLYVIQNVIIYSPTIPLFYLIRKRLGDNTLSMLLSLSYLFYPAIAPNPIEMITMFSGLAIFSYYFLDSNKKIPFAITFLLMLSTIEFSPIVGGAFFLLVLVRSPVGTKVYATLCRFIGLGANRRVEEFRGWKFFAFFTVAASVAAFILDLRFISFASVGSHSALANLYGTSVTSLTSIVSGLKTDPSGKLQYLVMLNSSYLFLGWFDPAIILQIPWLLAAYISSFSGYWSYGVYYQSYMIPFVVIGAFLTVFKISKREGKVDLSRVKRLTQIIFVVVLISWVASSGISYATSMPNHVSTGTQDGMNLLSTIGEGTPLTTSVNLLPLASSYTWDSVFYGPAQKYILGNISSANTLPSGYGVYSDSGPYVLWEKGYNGSPVQSDLNYQYAGGVDSSDTSLQIYIPKGNYSASLELSSGGTYAYIQSGKQSNNGTTQYFNVNNGIIVPFRFNSTVSLEKVVTYFGMTYGVYNVNSMITTNLSSGSAIGSTGSSLYASQTSYETFSYDLKLQGNRTYYLWVWSSGYPGGLYVPVYNGSRGYTFNSNFVAINSKFGTYAGFLVSGIKGSSEPMQYTLSSPLLSTTNLTFNRQYTFSISSNRSGFVPLNVSMSQSDYLMNVAPTVDLKIVSTHYRPSSDPFMNFTPIVFLLALLATPLFFVTGDEKHKLNGRKVVRYTYIGLVVVLELFFAVFSAEYLRILPVSPSLFVLKMSGIAVTILLFLLLYYYDWSDGAYGSLA